MIIFVYHDYQIRVENLVRDGEVIIAHFGDEILEIPINEFRLLSVKCTSGETLPSLEN